MEIFVVFFDDLMDDMRVEAHDEDETFDIEIEFERFEDLEGDLGHAAVEVVDEDDESVVFAQ